MALESVLLITMLALGVAAQRLADAERFRRALWLTFFSTISPVLVLVTFTRLEVDGTLVRALAAAVVATWLVAGLGYLYASAVARERGERGALALAAGFGNSGFVGYPLAALAFGPAGLALAVVYDRLAWLVPASAVSTAVARVHGRSSGDDRRGRSVRALLLNPPFLALCAAVALRATGTTLPDAETARSVAAALVGPVGFLLLGLSVPLERPEYEPSELRRAVGAVLIRMAGGPLVLLLAGMTLGARIPAVFYLLSGMPAAFHLLVLARVYDVRPALMRLLVVGSTIPAVVGVAVVVAFRGHG